MSTEMDQFGSPGAGSARLAPSPSSTRSFTASSLGSSQMSDGSHILLATSPVARPPARRTGELERPDITQRNVDQERMVMEEEATGSLLEEPRNGREDGYGLEEVPDNAVEDAQMASLARMVRWAALVASWHDPELSGLVLAVLVAGIFVSSVSPYALFSAWTYAYAATAFVATRVSCFVALWALDVARGMQQGSEAVSARIEQVAHVLERVCAYMALDTVRGPSQAEVGAVAHVAAGYVWRAQSWAMDAISLRQPVNTLFLLAGLWGLAFTQTLVATLFPVASALLIVVLTHGLWQEGLAPAILAVTSDLLPARYHHAVRSVVAFDYAEYLAPELHRL